MDAFQILEKIKDFFVLVKDVIVDLPWPNILSTLRIISVFASILLLGGIIFVIFGLRIIDRFRNNFANLIAPKMPKKRKLEKKWNRIERRLETGKEVELKLAVIEADKFFDNILKKIGYHGKDMGGRLKHINSSQITNINDIWDAHKIRNNIVHDTDHKLKNIDAEKSIKAYKEALEELEAL